MRHEIIRMEHVNISRPGRHEIEDLNLIICQGYSIGIAGVENSKETLSDFFEGKGMLTRGRIYLNGERWKPEGKRDFEDAGIFVISKDTAYMDSLDVSENLFLLRRNSLRKIWLNEKALHIQGRALLEKYNLPYAADEDSSHLKYGDRILIGILRAITQGARVLVLRGIVAFFHGEERRKLRQFVNQLKQEGITIISIDNRADFEDPFFDEVILFRHHTIYKKIWQDEDKWMIDAILKRGLKPADARPQIARPVSVETQIRPGEFFVCEILRDGVWQLQLSMKEGEILAALGTPEQVDALWADILHANNTQSRFEMDSQVIPYKNIQDLMKHRIALMEYGNHTEVCENLTNEENILLPAYPRICSVFGFYQKQQKYILEDNFLGTDRQEIESWNPETEAWKIGIYRYKLFHPRVLILKNMLQNLNVREVAWLKRELREIVERGSSVLLLENESKVCEDIADRLEVIA